MKALIVLLTLALTGCAGLTCNNGHRDDFFGDGCGKHGGVNSKATWGVESDPIELMAYTAYRQFHNEISVKTSKNGGPPIQNREADCDVHAKWVGERLAAQGIGGEMVIKKAEFFYHAAWRTPDGRYIDINFSYPLTESEWLEFVGRV